MGKFGQVLGKIGSGLLSAIPVVGPTISNIASSLIGAGQQNKNVRDTNQANLELAKYQYSKDLEMWNRQNEYNSPAAQMQRFKDAGLNPLLAYTQGTAGNATVLPKYQAPRLDYSQRVNIFSGILSAYQDFAVKSAQIDHLRAQAKVAQTEAEFARGYYSGRSAGAMGKGRAALQYYHWLASDPKNRDSGTMGFKLFDTQFDAKEQAVKKLSEDVIYRQKMNEWYVTGLLGRLGISAANALVGGYSKLLGAGVKGVSDQFRTGKSLNLPRYNSPQNWKNLGY